MHLLLSLLLFAMWSAAGRSAPICVPGSVNGDADAEETYGEPWFRTSLCLWNLALQCLMRASELCWYAIATYFFLFSSLRVHYVLASSYLCILCFGMNYY